MGKFSEIFNFDNIGGKIKNFARYSCWITIWLIWIAALIAFIILLCYEWLARLCWIPLVSAIVGPFFVWIGSWAVYAFGELVEDVHAIHNTKEIVPEKVNHEAKVTARYEEQKIAKDTAKLKTTMPLKDKDTCPNCGSSLNIDEKASNRCFTCRYIFK